MIIPSDLRPPMTHELKTWPRFFRDVECGWKRFEIRRGDRDFRAGDILHLREHEQYGTYTGRSCYVRVDYVTSLLPIYYAVGMGITLVDQE